MAIIEGISSGNKAEVDSNNQIKVVTSNTDAQTGSIRFKSEVDAGTITGSGLIVAPEASNDYRLRVGQESLLDHEIFNYTSQNTGKHSYLNATMTNGWTAGQMTTNSGSATANNNSTKFLSYAMFPLFGANSTYVQTILSVSATGITNTTVDFGLFHSGGGNPYAPTDGVYFRINSSGIFGVVNYNTSETATSAFTFTPTLNTRYKFVIEINLKVIRFWIDDVLYGSIATPVGNAQPLMSAAAPYSIRHAIAGGSASGVLQTVIGSYTITVDGLNLTDDFKTVGNRVFGSYQGLSGGTMGTLANYANSANPTSAAGANATANVTGLGGQGAVNAAAAAATDFQLCSYQVPAGTANVQGRRLVLTGVKISAANLGAAVATTATTVAYSLAFGHTAVSLGTTDTASTKAPRRIALGMQYWNVAAPIGATPQNGDLYMPFNSPIYVNPGDFIAVAMKFLVGTATASQSIWYHVTFDYGWE